MIKSVEVRADVKQISCYNGRFKVVLCLLYLIREVFKRLYKRSFAFVRELKLARTVNSGTICLVDYTRTARICVLNIRTRISVKVENLVPDKVYVLYSVVGEVRGILPRPRRQRLQPVPCFQVRDFSR